jgi:hypothetical protein
MSHQREVRGIRPLQLIYASNIYSDKEGPLFRFLCAWRQLIDMCEIITDLDKGNFKTNIESTFSRSCCV